MGLIDFRSLKLETGITFAIVRLDRSAADLRIEATRGKDASYARRVVALAVILEGAARKVAAETCGMDRQTLRDWVCRDNAEGLAGL